MDDPELLTHLLLALREQASDDATYEQAVSALLAEHEEPTA